VTGFLVGKDFESQGIIKKGSQLINAVSNSMVPHITIIVGASYGAGTYAMSGKAFNNRFTFLWPTAKIAVMGPEQMAGVMSIVRKAKSLREGQKFDEKADENLKIMVTNYLEKLSLGLVASSMVTDDGIIDPRDTRDKINSSLSLIKCASFKFVSFFN
ncbi:acyl-CoA carboxylase subunit beta, partial [Gammaproteobacteria bacterium]|nr:acyl-CoA carboxylase subunit beta [Gammaproteobacteria bacterium]